jgi:hypothetical protein
VTANILSSYKIIFVYIRETCEPSRSDLVDILLGGV